MTESEKIVDMRISRLSNGRRLLYVPIKSGSIEICIEYDADSQTIKSLFEFLDTAMKSKRRRFGENPT